MGRCPTAEVLERFAYGRLPESESAATELHLERCRRCAAVLARLPVGEDLLERIRDLERSHKELAPALSRLAQMEEAMTTTLFGRESSRPTA